MELFGESIGAGTAILLLLAIGLALAFEFVNGFHDTANAVATVIYTNSLKPVPAVVWSGLWNLAGVLLSSGAVAYGITALLPVELVLHVGSAAGFAMVFSLLLSAIVWNLGTWYFGLPASSSHTLIGSMMGVGLANSLMSQAHVFGEGVNWAKARETGIALLVSPLVGFCAAAALLLLAKALIRRPELFQPPDKDVPPPIWIRALLILTCTGVSFAHGSNDGQKGMGLITLILIGILPAAYALNPDATSDTLAGLSRSSQAVVAMLDAPSTGDPEPTLSTYLKSGGTATPAVYGALATVHRSIDTRLTGKTSLAQIPSAERQLLRAEIYLETETIAKLNKQGELRRFANPEALLAHARKLDALTKFIPNWVKLAVALALGLGTMIGWKRIVVTVGEKIGKAHLSYAQGAAAELVAMTTIGVADTFGLPVSTTHILSSGVAGSMAANRSGLQPDTLRNIALAWLLTLPVCMFMGGALFAFLLNVILGVGTR